MGAQFGGTSAWRLCKSSFGALGRFTINQAPPASLLLTFIKVAIDKESMVELVMV